MQKKYVYLKRNAKKNKCYIKAPHIFLHNNKAKCTAQAWKIFMVLSNERREAEHTHQSSYTIHIQNYIYHNEGTS